MKGKTLDEKSGRMVPCRFVTYTTVDDGTKNCDISKHGKQKLQCRVCITQY